MLLSSFQVVRWSMLNSLPVYDARLKFYTRILRSSHWFLSSFKYLDLFSFVPDSRNRSNMYLNVILNIRTRIEGWWVTSQNHHIWKWVVSLYPYMADTWRHWPPTIGSARGAVNNHGTNPLLSSVANMETLQPGKYQPVIKQCCEYKTVYWLSELIKLEGIS